MPTDPEYLAKYHAAAKAMLPEATHVKIKAAATGQIPGGGFPNPKKPVPDVSGIFKRVDAFDDPAGEYLVMSGGGADTSVDVAKADAPSTTVEILVPIVKRDAEKRIVYGMVLVPDRVDSQGDVVSADEIEKAAHAFMTDYRAQGVQHVGPELEDVRVVESYIAPCDMTLEDMDGTSVPVPKGTWMMGSHIGPDPLWAAVKKGDLASYSMQGAGLRKER